METVIRSMTIEDYPAVKALWRSIRASASAVSMIPRRV